LSAGRVTWLGPQRREPTLAASLQSLGLPADAQVATITAGWQEREDDEQELREHLGHRAVNLAIYRRTERVFERDGELQRAARGRQEDLKALQGLYRIRLHHAMNACFDLLRRSGNGAVLREERRAAIETVRELDRRHLEQVRERHDAFEQRVRPAERDALAHERAEVEKLVRESGAIAIAGGHVAVLLNRLRLFSFERLAAGRLVVAWSAGAMALSETVVLFRDDPPHGPGHPEALEQGLALASGVVPLPHARRRLDLDDGPRVLVMARRFAPAACVPMDEGARLDWSGASWVMPRGTRRLGIEGRVETWTEA